MKLSHVTLSGVDDGTFVSDLNAIADANPGRVEFGVLMSRSRQGSPRYPDRQWINWFARGISSNAKISAHLCGSLARSAVRNDGLTARELYDLQAFDRIQLNVGIPEGGVEHYWSARSALEGLRDYLGRPVEFIRQQSGYQAFPDHEIDHCTLVPLFDASGGRGIVPKEWPLVGLYRRFGFAGGLGPDNLAEQLKRMADGVPEDAVVWVDMESGIRTDDRFDVAKALKCLEVAQPWF